MKRRPLATVINNSSLQKYIQLNIHRSEIIVGIFFFYIPAKTRFT